METSALSITYTPFFLLLFRITNYVVSKQPVLMQQQLSLAQRSSHFTSGQQHSPFYINKSCRPSHKNRSYTKLCSTMSKALLRADLPQKLPRLRYLLFMNSIASFQNDSRTFVRVSDPDFDWKSPWFGHLQTHE